MSRFLSMMVALAVTLFAATGFAWSPPASPAPASWISDTSGVLSTDAHTRLDTKLKVINQSSANEITALIVQTLDGQDIADVANATFKSWGVGKRGLDNGVLVVLAIKDRKMRIETGKGVEGDLPDLKTQDIQNNVMRPRLRAGDVEGALGNGFDAIASSIANHKADVAAGRSSSRQGPSCQVSSVGSDSGSGWILLFVAGGTIALVWYVARRTRQRREKEEADRLASLERQATRRRQVEEREAARKRDAERARLASLNVPTPVVQVPTVPRSNPPVPRPTVPRPSARPHPVTTVAVPVAASIAAAAAEEDARRRAAEAARRRRESEEADARRARERADEDRRRRDREDEDRRSSSSSSSSSSFDWGSSSSGGGSDSGGFGGGDSGGGGSSGDW